MEDTAEVIETVMYRANNAPSLKVHLGRDEKRRVIQVKFQHGILHLSDPKLIRLLDLSIADGLGHLVQRINVDAGLAAAKAHQDAMLHRAQIAKGSTTTGHLAHETVRAPEAALEAQLRDPARQVENKEFQELKLGADPVAKPEPEPSGPDNNPADPEPAENKQPGDSPLDDLLR